MNRWFLAAVPVLAALILVFPTVWASSPVEGDPQAVAASETAFGLDLYAKLRSEPGNVFCSPFSIAAALTMTSRGADGDTLAEMRKVLHHPASGGGIHANFAALVKSLTTGRKKDSPQLDIANALWGSAKTTFKPDFLAALKEHYGAGFQTVDFNNAEAARKQINGWVEAQTKNKIKDLFAPGVIDPATRLVLANAIYFKGSWLHKFEKKATKDEPFFASNEVKAPMMHQTESMKYAESETWQAVELFYRDSTLAMSIVLPRERDGLEKIESQFNAEMLSKIFDHMGFQEVRLSLPRFKSESQFSLKDTLSSMGMSQAFTDAANFKRMADEPLMIQAVVHKAMVDVNEEGTEAAAATGISMAPASAAIRHEPKVVRCDHPFLYMIRDTKSGAVLFLGRLENPTK